MEVTVSQSLFFAEIFNGIMRTIVSTLVVMSVLSFGCENSGKTTSTTRGEIRVVFDESVQPAFQRQVDDFQSTYPDAKVQPRYREAREAVVDFVSDSVRVIGMGRPFNAEELRVLKEAEIEYQSYEVALDGIVVIVHKENRISELRMSQLDSIFSGALTRWPGRNATIEPVVGDINSSVYEMVRDSVLKGKSFARSTTRVVPSLKLIDYVSTIKNSIGLVGLSWLRGHEDEVTVVRLSRLDSTGTYGKPYSPAQAYIYQRNYPLFRMVYMYNREIQRDVSLGLIAYMAGVQGQKIFLNSGLVPVTMPVRLVELTSKQVQQQ